MLYRKEYYKHPYYFFLKEGKEDITLYFSVESTLTEARNKDEKISFNKKDKKTVEKELTKIFQDKKLKNTQSVKKKLEKIKSEIDELVDSDGTFLSSKVPILDPRIAPKGTTDQEVVATRQTNNPVTRGYRVYWGESEDEDGNVISEIDFSDAFGYEETKDLNGPETFETFIEDLDLSPDEAAERTLSQGKEFDKKRHDKKLKRVPEKIKKDKNYIDTFTIMEKNQIEEIRRKRALKMFEDKVLKNKNKEKEISGNKSISKILTQNLNSIKKIADKEGISIEELIKILKKGE
jgi:hypothetical protein